MPAAAMDLCSPGVASTRYVRSREVTMPRKGQRQPPHATGPNGTISVGKRYGFRKRAALEAEHERVLEALFSPGASEIEAFRRSGAAVSDSTALAMDFAAAPTLRLRRAIEGEPAPPSGPPPHPLSPQRVARLG